MARSDQIEWAAKVRKAPPVGRFHDDHVLHMARQDDDTRAQERDRARRYVTRWATARGDVAAGAQVLDALGLEAA